MTNKIIAFPFKCSYSDDTVSPTDLIIGPPDSRWTWCVFSLSFGYRALADSLFNKVFLRSDKRRMQIPSRSGLCVTRLFPSDRWLQMKK